MLTVHSFSYAYLRFELCFYFTQNGVYGLMFNCVNQCFISLKVCVYILNPLYEYTVCHLYVYKEDIFPKFTLAD